MSRLSSWQVGFHEGEAQAMRDFLKENAGELSVLVRARAEARAEYHERIVQAHELAQGQKPLGHRQVEVLMDMLRFGNGYWLKCWFTPHDKRKLLDTLYQRKLIAPVGNPLADGDWVVTDAARVMVGHLI